MAHIQAYKKMLPMLIDNMKLPDLLPKLISQNVITVNESTRIKHGKVEIDSVNELVTGYLMKQPEEDSFFKVLQALRDSNQEHLADKLEIEYLQICETPENNETEASTNQLSQETTHVMKQINQDESDEEVAAMDTSPSTDVACGELSREIESNLGSLEIKIADVILTSQDDLSSSLLKAVTKATGRDWESLKKPQKERTEEEAKSAKGVSVCLQEYASKIDYKASVRTYEGLLKYSKFVCYIKCLGGTATGFVLGTLLNPKDDKKYVHVMTNLHVLCAIRKSWANFDGGIVAFDYVDESRGYKEWPIVKDRVIMEDEELDFAIICLDPKVDPLEHITNPEGLGKYVAHYQKSNEHEILQLIGHPMGKEKIIDHLVVVSNAKSEVLVLTNYPNRMHYDCSSFDGASGSPYFHGERLIGLHTSGLYMKNKEKTHSVEVGVPMSLILPKMLSKIECDSNSLLNKEGFYTLFPQARAW